MVPHSQDRSARHGRGATSNPVGRFERLEVVDAPGCAPDAPRTELIPDHSRSVLTRNESPDVRARVTLNPYRGCEHGCAYCFARPTHEYLGFSAGLDFESRILVKYDAAAQLRAELSRPGWEPQPVLMSGVTDPYQPVEQRLGITRACLEVFRGFRNPVAVITKGAGVLRDLDHLTALASHDAVVVLISLTTLDRDLQRALEPRAATPRRRLEIMRSLADAGVPVGAMVAPVIPGLTDHEVPALVDAAARAGARSAGYVLLRLPHGVKDIFSDWLHAFRPERAEKVLGRVRDLRGGRLNDPRFGARMRGEGPFAEQLATLFDVTRRRAGLAARPPELRVDGFRRPGQMDLFS